MKKILSLIIPALLVFVLAGCHYHNINGDLDGQWQLMSVDLPDGTQQTPQQVYYCFFMHTANVTSTSQGSAVANMTYDKHARTLALEFPYKGTLSPWGLPDAPCTVKFTINKINRKHLVMTLDGTEAVMTLRKF